MKIFDFGGSARFGGMGASAPIMMIEIFYRAIFPLLHDSRRVGEGTHEIISLARYHFLKKP